MRRSLSALAAVALLAAAPVALQAQTFDFEGAETPIGWTTPFSVTRDGLTASFSSTNNAAPSVYVVSNSFFSTLTGRVLLDADGVNTTALQVLFDRPLTTAAMKFALNATDTPASFTLMAYLGATLVGQVSASGTIPPQFGFPEGQIAFTDAGGFDRIVLSSTATDFAIDDVTVRQAQVVPEPATVALLGAGVVALGVGGAWRRRRAA